jgi:molybdopterin-guanine dinucleotide biosynthesis protein A
MNALILSGGHSSRMGRDKALINYLGQPHAFFLRKLVAPWCEQTLISCRKEQQPTFEQAGYDGNFLFDDDKWGDIGPLKALLTAFEYQNTDWLVLACDYPLFSKTDVTTLLHHHHPEALATVFKEEHETFCEPLLGIYSKNAREYLLEWHQKGQQSLQKFLMQHQPVNFVAPPHPFCFVNANSEADFQRILGFLDNGIIHYLNNNY